MKYACRVLTLIFYVVVELPAMWVLLAWFVLQLFSGVGQIGMDTGGGVAYWAHVGGFGFGALVAWLFRAQLFATPLPAAFVAKMLPRRLPPGSRTQTSAPPAPNTNTPTPCGLAAPPRPLSRRRSCRRPAAGRW